MKHNISSSLDIVSKKLGACIEDYRIIKFERNSVVICTEPLYLEDKDLKDFEFWVELNKMIGYEKMCLYHYANKAKLVLVQDNDETFIPPECKFKV